MRASGPELRDLLREKALWILLVLTLLFFWRPLTSETFFFRDLYLYSHAKKVYLAEALARGELPLWNPYQHGGQPFIGNPNQGSLYPINLLYLVLPAVAALNVFLVLHYLLAAFGCYLLARRCGFRQVGSFVAGAAFTFCGYTLSAANLTVPLLGFAWMPLFVAGMDGWIRFSRRRFFALAIGSATMTLLAGSIEMAAVMFLLAACWIAGVMERGGMRRGLAALLLPWCAAVGLSLVQILPASEVVRESSRAERRSWDSFTAFSVHPMRLPELVVPGYFGETDTLAESDYWGSRYEHNGFPYILSIYIGAPLLLLAIAGTVTRSGTVLPRRLRLLLLALVMSGILFSLGRYLPGFRFVYDYIPGVTTFRYPVKALTFAVLPLALLAAEGLQVAAGAPRRFAWIFAAGSALAAGVVLLVPLPSEAISPKLWQVAAVLLACALSCAVGAGRPLAAPVLLAAVVFIDLAAAGWRVNAYAPRAFFGEPPVARVVAALTRGGRFYRSVDPPGLEIRAPSNDIAWLHRWNLEVLKYTSATIFGIPQIFHSDDDGLAPRETMRLTRAVEQANWPTRVSLLRLGGVRAFITADRVDLPSVRLASPLINPSNTTFYLYALPQSQEAYFTATARDASGDAAVAVMRAPGYEPYAQVLLEGRSSASRCAGRVLSLRQTLNSWRAEVESECAGFVVLSLPYFRGWRGEIDGAGVPLFRANVAFTAVDVPAGRHRISLRYFPPTLLPGIAGTLLTAALLGWWFVRGRDSATALSDLP